MPSAVAEDKQFVSCGMEKKIFEKCQHNIRVPQKQPWFTFLQGRGGSSEEYNLADTQVFQLARCCKNWSLRTFWGVSYGIRYFRHLERNQNASRIWQCYLDNIAENSSKDSAEQAQALFCSSNPENIQRLATWKQQPLLPPVTVVFCLQTKPALKIDQQVGSQELITSHAMIVCEIQGG